MFTFIYDIMDMYYQKKVLSISNHRFDTYVALRFQGLNAKKIPLANINQDEKGWYKVKNCTHDRYYDINVNLGLCTCEKGQDGSPCVHQAAGVLQFGKKSLNYIATLATNARLKLATIALGNGAIKQLSFYTSLHQQSLEKSFNQPKTNKQDPGNFVGSEWDLIRSNGDHFSVHESDMTTEVTVDIN